MSVEIKQEDANKPASESLCDPDYYPRGFMESFYPNAITAPVLQSIENIPSAVPPPPSTDSSNDAGNDVKPERSILPDLLFSTEDSSSTARASTTDDEDAFALRLPPYVWTQARPPQSPPADRRIVPREAQNSPQIPLMVTPTGPLTRAQLLDRLIMDGNRTPHRHRRRIIGSAQDFPRGYIRRDMIVSHQMRSGRMKFKVALGSNSSLLNWGFADSGSLTLDQDEVISRPHLVRPYLQQVAIRSRRSLRTLIRNVPALRDYLRLPY